MSIFLLFINWSIKLIQPRCKVGGRGQMCMASKCSLPKLRMTYFGDINYYKTIRLLMNYVVRVI